MTNDPSMTITSTSTSTSTTPAPEGSNDTSREGKTIPLPMMECGNAPPASDTPPDMVKSVGGTTFDIRPLAKLS